MLIYPAIDVKGGRLARVTEGGRNVEPTYVNDPIEQARDFLRRGASWLHVVDMDRAFETGGDNTDVLRGIIALGELRIQLGGKIDSLASLRHAASIGPTRVVLGTTAALSPGLLAALVANVEGMQTALALDTSGGKLKLRDDREPRNETVSALVEIAQNAGIRTIIYRDVSRDGTACGAEIEGARALVPMGVDVIAAGGVADLDDIRAARDAGLAGVIVGRALYEGRFGLEEALRCSS